MGSRLKIVTLLYEASTSFSVAVQYCNASVWRRSSKAGCVLYTGTPIFPINSNEKSACVLCTSAYYTQDFTALLWWCVSC